MSNIQNTPSLVVLASFDGVHGSRPQGSLILDGSGDLFGSTQSTDGSILEPEGTVFELPKTGPATYATTTTELAGFTGTNGNAPNGGLIQGAGGQLLGTTELGGSGGGTVFSVLSSSPYTLTTLNDFSTSGASLPTAGLVSDADGNLFGITMRGGAVGGTVFEMARSGQAYMPPTTLASVGDNQGGSPAGSLIIDQAGDLFGTTGSSGINDPGTVFEIAKGANGYAGSATTLATLSGQSPSGLVADASGNLYGTTQSDSTDTSDIVYEIPKTASGYGSTVTLASFPNSAAPEGPLLIDVVGDLFGVTRSGGANGYGEIFEIPKINGVYPPNSTTPAALASFDQSDASPAGGLAVDSNGNLFGASNSGNGAIFELANSGYRVTVPPPMVTGVSGSAAHLDVGAGSVVTITVNFNTPVAVTPGGGGTVPTLTLNDGGTASYTGGTGSNALTFAYDVAAGQNTTSLAVSTVQLNNATIADASSAQAADLSGAVASVAGAPQIDTTAPVVSGISVTPSSGDLGAGQLVTLTVNMSEPVTVDTTDGLPTLTLNDGGTATYSGGSGSHALSFTTTIAPGNNAAALAVTGAALNDATIADGAGNAADLSAVAMTPAGAPQIDTIAPTLTGVSASAASDDVGIGQTVTLTVQTSEPVNVNVTGGTPSLTLSDGGTATYAGGSGTDALTFDYVVQPGQFSINAPTGIGSVESPPRLAVTGVSTNGGTIQDGAGNDAALSSVTLGVDNAPEIDGIAPTVTGVEAIAPADVGIGQTITLAVDLSTAVTVTGAPSLHLNDGASAGYEGGSGTDVLTFTQVVAAGDASPQLAVDGYDWQNASVLDAAGNEADLNGVFDTLTNAPEVDGTVPTITGIAATAPSGDVGIGQTVTLTVSLNEAVTVDTTQGSPTLSLSNGGSATYAGGSGTDALTFRYVVQPGQHSQAPPAGETAPMAPPPWLAVTHVRLNGAVIEDTAGNSVDLTSAYRAIRGAPEIDGIAPTVTFVDASAPAADVGIGQTVTLTVGMSEAVAVDTTAGAPTLQLNDGGTAVYAGGSGTDALNFTYTVASGQSTPALTVIGSDFGGATIQDDAGNDANLGNAVTTPTNAPQVDGIAPAITAVSATTPSADIGIGQTVTLTVDYSEAVTVLPAAPSSGDTGAVPTLALNDGGSAIYAGGSGTDALTFTYTVAAGENTPSLGITGAVANGAAIEDSTGNAPNLMSGVPAISGAPQVDTTAPTVAGVSASSASADISTGQTVTLTVGMSEAVSVDTADGTPTLQLNDGGTASYTGGSGTEALSFTYTVAAGDSTPALAVTGSTLNGGTITDGAGNAADLSNVITTPTGAPAVNAAPSGSGITLADTTADTSGTSSGSAYTGPVSGIQYQYITTTSHNLSLATTTPNWFIHSGAGDDAIDVSRGGGTNVLDGSTGSNFLTGGSGADTFFVDDRAPAADIWSTVSGFHAGDAATLWGVTPSDFALNWADGQGAAGYTGLTLHATAAGQPTASLTLVGYTQADLTDGRLSVSYGHDQASGLSYMYVHGNG